MKKKLTDLSVAEVIRESFSGGPKWRGAPFWALNGQLSATEIRAQIRGFQKCGLGGFFLHSRTGLQTPYLSEAFFDGMAAAVDEAEKCQMQAWLYDEDRYPSGSGGGFVTCDPAFRAKGIFLAEIPFEEAGSFEIPFQPLALFAGVVQNDEISHLRRLVKEDKLRLNPEETLLFFYTDTIQCSSWYNGYTYLDTLSESAVRKFIEVTHEKYRRHFGSKFGTVVPGIFTDEPRYGFLIDQPEWDTEKRPALPWTPGLLEAFRQKYKYDAADHLPALFFDVKEEDTAGVRFHYVQLLTEFFLKAFARQISSWCRENSLIFTGHTVAEDSLSYQTLCVGSVMRFYEYMDMPGMDLLTEHHRAYQTAKQVSSAARQLGKTRRLAELYGCTGWDFPIAGFYALGNWLYALGINFRCQHLAFYTLEGEAKRDYPAPVALHSNAPADYRQMETHFARLAPWLSAGKEERNILLLSPVESAWTFFCRRFRQKEKTHQFDVQMTALTHFLLAQQLDHDYADEDILARHGRVEGRNLIVGEAVYSVVVVPEVITLRQTSFELLKAFQLAGGEVLTLSEAPAYRDGFKYVFENWNFEKLTSYEMLLNFLEKYRLVSVTEPAGKNCSAVLYQLRRGTDWDAAFFCNTGEDMTGAEEDGASYQEKFVFDRQMIYPETVIEIKSNKTGGVFELDTVSGQFYACQAEYCSGKWRISAGFDRLQSRLFVMTDKKDIIPHSSRPPRVRMRLAQQIGPENMFLKLSEPNVLLLDHFSCGKTETPRYVLELDDCLRRQLGLDIRQNVMIQPWCRKKDDRSGGEVQLFARFDCAVLPEGELFLVLERPELYRAFLNGQELKMVPAGFWHEKIWQKIPLEQEMLKKGENLLELNTRLDAQHPGLESVFILGNFGVYQKGNVWQIGSLPARLFPGSWTEQGLPFYAGNVTGKVSVTLEKTHLGRIRLAGFEGTPAIIKADEREIGRVLFSPGETRDVLLPETFLLEVTLTGSMRNACGPFFAQEVRPVWCGPDAFKTKSRPERLFSSFGWHGMIEIYLAE